MSQASKIVDEESLFAARVTSRGELVVGALSYSDPYYVRVSAAATETLIVPAKEGMRFVVRDLMVTTDKDFASATSGELIEVYEALPHDITTVEKTIFKVELLKNDRLVAIGLNLITSNTVTIVAVADDNNVDITLAGYYVDN